MLGLTEAAMSIQEIKRLLCEGLDAKVLMNGDDFAEQALRKAALLSETVSDDIWSNLPKYRLAHLLFRNAKNQQKLEEIHVLLTSVSESSAHPIVLFGSKILLLAVANRLKNFIPTKNTNDQVTLIEEAVRLLRRHELSEFQNGNHGRDLNNQLFNMLELAIYFTGESYEKLDGLGLSHSYIPLLPSQPSSVWRIVEENGFSDQLAYPESLGREELLRMSNSSSIDLYYIYGEKEFRIYSKSHTELKTTKYHNDRTSLRTLASLHQNYHYGLSSDELLTVSGSTQNDPQVPRHIRRSLNALIEKPLIVQTAWGPQNTRFSINPDIKIVGLISQKLINAF